MKKKAVLIIGLFLFFIGCAPQNVRERVSPPMVSETVSPTKEKAGWELEWNKTIVAANRENKVVVYNTSNSTVLTAIGTAFKRKYGLELENITGRGAELAVRLLNERKAGLYMADLYMAGTTTPVVTLKPAGALDPLKPALILPEVVNPGAWYGGDLRWVDPQFNILGFLAYPNALVVVNTQLVKKGEVKSLQDLLNPMWKGKIVMNDPSVAGTGSKSFVVIGWQKLNLDYWRNFAKQEPAIMRDQRLLIEWVARGKYAIAFAPRPPEVAEFKTAGAPIEYIMPEEGTYLSTGSGAIALINKARHPNAAKVFLNWLLSREGQTVFTQAHGANSARVDVPTEGLDPELIRQPGVKYFLGADTEEWLLKEPERNSVAKEIFKDLMK